jgi:hypothetical protein
MICGTRFYLKAHGDANKTQHKRYYINRKRLSANIISRKRLSKYFESLFTTKTVLF